MSLISGINQRVGRKQTEGTVILARKVGKIYQANHGMMHADKRCREKMCNIDTWTHLNARKQKKPESIIVLNVNKHSNYAAAAKFKLKEKTFAKEFIK